MKTLKIIAISFAITGLLSEISKGAGTVPEIEVQFSFITPEQFNSYLNNSEYTPSWESVFQFGDKETTEPDINEIVSDSEVIMSAYNDPVFTKYGQYAWDGDDDFSILYDSEGNLETVIGGATYPNQGLQPTTAFNRIIGYLYDDEPAQATTISGMTITVNDLWSWDLPDIVSDDGYTFFEISFSDTSPDFNISGNINFYTGSGIYGDQITFKTIGYNIPTVPEPSGILIGLFSFVFALFHRKRF